MIFLGTTFCGARRTLDRTADHLSNITKISLYNGVHDDVFVSKDASFPYTDKVDTTWDYDTVLHCDFDGNAIAGNVDYLLSQIDAIVIKRRPSDGIDWVRLFEIPIEGKNDFNFIRYDRYARCNTSYDYAFVTLSHNVEGNMIVERVDSSFDGLFICERDLTFSTLFDVGINTNKNRATQVVDTLSRKYPFVVSNGMNNYYSGDVSAVFIKQQADCVFMLDNAQEYRRELYECLTNGKPKIIKYDDGRMWLVSISDPPAESHGDHPMKPETSFGWVEIANCDTQEGLSECGLIDVRGMD